MFGVSSRAHRGRPGSAPVRRPAPCRAPTGGDPGERPERDASVAETIDREHLGTGEARVVSRAHVHPDLELMPVSEALGPVSSGEGRAPLGHRVVCASETPCGAVAVGGGCVEEALSSVPGTRSIGGRRRCSHRSGASPSLRCRGHPSQREPGSCFQRLRDRRVECAGDSQMVFIDGIEQSIAGTDRPPSPVAVGVSNLEPVSGIARIVANQSRHRARRALRSTRTPSARRISRAVDSSPTH